jgi:glycosidase
MGRWWQEAVIYQVYPRSFQDSNGDGIGDLAGVERRLGYLEWLGVDTLWLSPFYPSPMADFGYDVADYCDVDPIFGTLADFDRLLAQAHARGMKLIVDFVPNHTSDRHPWFSQSRASRTNPKRDWYIWCDPAEDGGPPNNWISDFGGSAWEWDAATGQYYYHAFLKEQPDLNWRNPDVRRAMYDAMRFWLERGVDGFRLDVLWHLIKAEGFPDNPINPDFHPGMGEMHRVLQTQSTDQPGVHEIAREMRRIADEYGDRVLIGEIYLPFDRLVRYYGAALDEVQLPFNFALIGAPWDARSLAALIRRYEAALPPGGWPNWVLGNHDRPRIASRVGEAQARVAAMLLLTLRGTPTLYYGDELGLSDVDIPLARARDPRELREPGLGLGRDPVRTPMPWSDAPHAGFSEAEPWLPLNPDWETRNVAEATADAGSMLTLTRALLRLRRERPPLALGAIRVLQPQGDVLAYVREGEGERVLVALNLGREAQEMALPDEARGAVPLLSTWGARERKPLEALSLRADEGVILALPPQP